MTALSLCLDHQFDHSTLTLVGELDTVSAPLVQPAVDTVIDIGRRHLTVDTEKLTFCDSSGLRALLRAQDSLTLVGATMELTHVHNPLKRVLTVTGLAGAFVTSPVI
jgi:anti-anti-sigma factor